VKCALRDSFEACADRPLRDLVIGLLAWASGNACSAETWLARAARHGAPPAVGAEALATLATLQAVEARDHDAVASARGALSLGPTCPVAQQRAWKALSLGVAMVEGPR